MKNNKNVLFLARGALIASLYVVLTYVVHMFGLDSGAIQVRISEALVALLYFTPAAIPGLCLGCFLSNLLVGGVIADIMFGTLATFLGAVAGYFLRSINKYLVLIPSIISNTIIIPFVLIYSYNVGDAWWYLMLTVGIGEIISCGVFGAILLKSLEKHKLFR